MLTEFANDMGTRELLVPAIAHVNLSIGQTVAIPDEEVIAKPLIAPAEMSPMNRLGRPEGFTKVMNHDSLPTITIQ